MTSSCNISDFLYNYNGDKKKVEQERNDEAAWNTIRD